MLPKLLVIDDVSVHRGVFSRLAEKAHFKPTGAASVEEADRLLQEQTFDCIILDLSLGDRAGAEILYLLSDQGIRAPVIIISGAADAVVDEALIVGRMLGLNIRQPIPKPVDLARLRGELRMIDKIFDPRSRS
jgi:DNA-binding response OmpR family regulator